VRRQIAPPVVCYLPHEHNGQMINDPATLAVDSDAGSEALGYALAPFDHWDIGVPSISTLGARGVRGQRSLIDPFRSFA
jgi:hypothetical protein